MQRVGYTRSRSWVSYLYDDPTNYAPPDPYYQHRHQHQQTQAHLYAQQEESINNNDDGGDDESDNGDILLTGPR